jgi:hypothetical protein
MRDLLFYLFFAGVACLIAYLFLIDSSFLIELGRRLRTTPTCAAR